MGIRIYFVGGKTEEFEDYTTASYRNGVIYEVGDKKINPDNVLWSEPI